MTENSRRHATSIKQHAENASFCARKAYENDRAASQARADLDTEAAEKAATAARIFADAAIREYQDAYDKLHESYHENDESPEHQEALRDLERAETRAEAAKTYADEAQEAADNARREKESRDAAALAEASYYADEAETAADEAAREENEAQIDAQHYARQTTTQGRQNVRRDATWRAAKARAAAQRATKAHELAQDAAQHTDSAEVAKRVERARAAAQRADERAYIAEVIAHDL